jgi:hypothetical protein
MSESTASDISKVLKRWLSINRHLVDCQRVKPFEDDLSRFNMTTFHQRSWISKLAIYTGQFSISIP